MWRRVYCLPTVTIDLPSTPGTDRHPTTNSRQAVEKEFLLCSDTCLSLSQSGGQKKIPQPARICLSFISCVSLRVHPIFIPFIFYLSILFLLFYNFPFLLLLIPCFYLSYFILTFLFIHSLFFSSPAACEVQNELIYSLIQSSAQSLLHQVFVLFCFLLFSLAARAVRTSIPWRVNNLGARQILLSSGEQQKLLHSIFLLCILVRGHCCCLLCFSCPT